MPFWYAIGFSLILAEAVIAWRQSGILPIWFAASSILWMLVIVYTITTLVPINNRIASWETSTPPADWKTYRSRWDLLHRWRVAVLTIAFALLVLGIL
jgi:uncharacterized membrane protein